MGQPVSERFSATLMQEWSDRNSRPLTAYTHGSHYRAWWRCQQGHEWQSQIKHRTQANRPNRCPLCYRVKRVHARWASLLKLAAEWSSKNGIPLTTYAPGSRYRAWWQCAQGHEWRASVYNRTRPRRPTGCPHCQRVVNARR
jgi:hypothetical protein